MWLISRLVLIPIAAWRAQKVTDLRRLRSEVEADQAALRKRQAELEELLAASPAKEWSEAVERHATCLASSPRAWTQAIPAVGN